MKINPSFLRLVALLDFLCVSSDTSWTLRNRLADRPLEPMQWNGAMDENKTGKHPSALVGDSQ